MKTTKPTEVKNPVKRLLPVVGGLMATLALIAGGFVLYSASDLIKTIVNTAKSETFGVKACLYYDEPLLCRLASSAKLDQLSPLHIAIVGKKTQVIDHLVEQEIYLNRKYRNGVTPLMVALLQKDEPTVKKLLSKGADPKVSDDKGRDAFYYAKTIGAEFDKILKQAQ